MTGDYSMIPNAVGQPRSPIIYATVSSTQPTPSGFTDPLYVVEPWNPHHYRTIDKFPALWGGTLPQAGDDVMLIYDRHAQKMRCVWWNGVYTAP